MGLKNAWQRLKMIWNFAFGALVGGAGVVASYFWFAAHPSNPRSTRPSYGSARPFPWAAAWRRTAARMAFRAERRGRLRGQVWMRETII